MHTLCAILFWLLGSFVAVRFISVVYFIALFKVVDVTWAGILHTVMHDWKMPFAKKEAGAIVLLSLGLSWLGFMLAVIVLIIFKMLSWINRKGQPT